MITIKYIKDHFESKGYEPRHKFDGLKAACNKLSKEEKIDARDLFHLLIENRPIGGITHSYGFHTGTGRYLIDTLSSYYYRAIK
jgi:hypothetical protein